MSEVSTSRRAVMRALAIVPTIIAVPAAASAATGLVCAPAHELAATIAEFHRLRLNYESHPVHDTYLDDPAYEAASADSDRAIDEMESVLDRALHIPSRSGADIAAKLELILKDYQDCTIPEDLLRIVADDARRLAGRA